MLLRVHHLASLPGRARRWLSYDPGRGRSTLRGPTTVQLQTVNRCNGSCIMCPYGASAAVGPAEAMDERLYLRILRQAGRTGATRDLVLMLQNEPLLDPALPRRVRRAREILGPRARVKTVTNGSLLTPDKAGALIEAGIDVIDVSVDAHSPETYARIRPGLDFGEVVANTQAALAGRGRTRISARFLRQRDNAAEEEAFVRYWRSRGASVRFIPLSNRAGSVPGFEDIRPPSRRPLRALARTVLGRFLPRCLFPFIAVAVLCDGRVLVCCQDWGPRDIVGDLTRQSLAEVWNGEAMNHYRHLLWSWRPEDSAVCRDCSVARSPADAAD